MPAVSNTTAIVLSACRRPSPGDALGERGDLVGSLVGQRQPREGRGDYDDRRDAVDAALGLRPTSH
jgi:hypothetical protein